MHLWFAKVLLVVKIRHTRKSNEQCRTHKRQCCIECELHWDEGMAFVQWFEVINERMLPIDEIDCTLKCVRLIWQQTSGQASQLTSAPEFSLILLEFVRGYANLVGRDFANDILNDSSPQKPETMNLCEEIDGWPSHLFYMNRLYNMQTVR